MINAKNEMKSVTLLTKCLDFYFSRLIEDILDGTALSLIPSCPYFHLYLVDEDSLPTIVVIRWQNS